jgi:hypothetical protein
VTAHGKIRLSRSLDRFRGVKLGVLVLDARAFVVVASDAAVATEGAAAVTLLAANAEAEQDGCEQKSGKASPGKAERPSAERRRATGRMEVVSGNDKGGSHERNRNGVAKESEGGSGASNGRAKAAEEGQEAREEGNDVEEEGDDEEDPSEAPKVVELSRSGVTAMATVQTRRHVGCIAVPSTAKGRGRASATAVGVTLAAEVEVVPLGDGPGAGDARGIGAEEVGVVEGAAAGDAAKDDEEEEEDGDGVEDEACKAEDAVSSHYVVVGCGSVLNRRDMQDERNVRLPARWKREAERWRQSSG